jgi:hypothetical protein
MRPFAMLGNESQVVVIGTYCHDSALIATNTVVAIDPISCSEGDDDTCLSNSSEDCTFS